MVVWVVIVALESGAYPTASTWLKPSASPAVAEPGRLDLKVSRAID